MSAEYEGKDPLELAKQAERDINSYENKTGNAQAGASDSSDNRDIPVEEGGDIQKGGGRLTKAGDFDQGEAGEGPEDILRVREKQSPGSDEFGRRRRELQDQVRGTSGGYDGAGAPVNPQGSRQN